MQISVSGYETRVKVFMILVVLFLATANLITVTFLIRSEDLLMEEARARAVTAALSIAAQASAEGIVGRAVGGKPGAHSRVAADLFRYGRAHGASVVDVVDRSGQVIGSSQTWRLGSVEPVDEILGPSALPSLQPGRAVLGPPGGPLTTAFVQLRSDAVEGEHYLRAGFALEAAGTISRQIRFLTWAQGIGGTVVLVLVLLFTRYVLRPYRELRAAAEEIEPATTPRAGAGDPSFLVASFRGVVDKMRFLEGELERMRSGASSPGGQESLLASLSSGVLILEESGRVAALNPAGEAILGMSAGEIGGRDMKGALAGSPELMELLADALHHGRGRSRQVVAHRLPTGRTVHLGVTISSPPGGAGGALCLFSDLTEIRTVQDRVILKENLARLGELSAGIAHEFRNSLATILGYARLAGREESDSADHAAAIIREVKAMERVVGEFLRYAGPARLQKGECHLRELLAGITDELVEEGEARVERAIEGDWPEVIHADETLLRQAFHNLLRNAVEAIRSKGGSGRVTVTGSLDGETVVVEVADSGPGFPEELLTSLFTPFVTTKERGTGLGMALAQKVVVSHDGSIEAGNDPGGGARVRVVLPLA
jgi:PAS domain S-box-containing protein